MTKWFGDPWPSAEKRAPVCRDDRDRVPIPVGASCAMCRRMILASDRGVLLPHLHESGRMGQRGYHLKCFLLNILGPNLAETFASQEESRDDRADER